MNPTRLFLRFSFLLALAAVSLAPAASARPMGDPTPLGAAAARLSDGQTAVLERAVPSREDLASIPEGCFLFSLTLAAALEESGRFDEVALANVRATGARRGAPDHTVVLFRSGQEWFVYETNFGLQCLGEAGNRDRAEAAAQRVLLRNIRSRRPSQVPASESGEAAAVSRAQKLVDGVAEVSRVDTFRGGRVSVLVFRTRTGYLGMYEPGSGTAWGEYRATSMPSRDWVETFLTEKAGFKAFSS